MTSKTKAIYDTLCSFGKEETAVSTTHRDGCICLIRGASFWMTYQAENGEKLSPRMYTSETDAALDVLERIAEMEEEAAKMKRHYASLV